MVSLGGRLKAARMAAHLTLDSVASEIGLSKQAVFAWESGRTNCTALQLAMLAVIYGTSSDCLLFGVNNVTAEMVSAIEKAERA
jgi:HTH-type transcriptional regulator, cell division transcriptional repressor